MRLELTRSTTSESDLPRVLVAYTDALDKVFQIALIFGLPEYHWSSGH